MGGARIFATATTNDERTRQIRLLYVLSYKNSIKPEGGCLYISDLNLQAVYDDLTKT